MNEDLFPLRSTVASSDEERANEQAIIARYLDQANVAAPSSSSTKYVVTSQECFANVSTDRTDSFREVMLGNVKMVAGKKYEMVVGGSAVRALSGNSFELILRGASTRALADRAACSTTTGSLGRIEDSERLTRNDMRKLAAENPQLLIAHVGLGQMRPAQLAFAAELLGEVSEKRRAERALLGLVSHDSAIVREGAVYGLRKLDTEKTWAAIREIAEHDRSPGVREAAAESLEEAQVGG